MSYSFNESLAPKVWNPAASVSPAPNGYPHGQMSLPAQFGDLDYDASKDLEKKGVAPGVRRQFHRTKLCRHFLKGNCLYGDECSYAHTETDIQSRPDLSKTRLCQQFVTGYCRRGDRCQFAHGLNDLKFTPGVFKTVMCSWWQKGRCDLGSHCRFAHGDVELKPVQSVSSKPHSVPNIMRRPPGRNAPVPPSLQGNYKKSSDTSVPPSPQLFKPGSLSGCQPMSYAPQACQMSAVAAAAAAAATAAVKSFDDRAGSSRPHHAAVLAAATAAAHAAMNQAEFDPLSSDTIPTDIHSRPTMNSNTWLPHPAGHEELDRSNLSYLPPPNKEKQEGNTSVTSVRSSWDPPALFKATTEEAQRECMDESDADSVLAPLPKASDLKGSTGNLNMLKLANLGFSALQKRFASSPALTTILDNLTKPAENFDEAEESDYGDDFPTQTITIEHGVQPLDGDDQEESRRRADSDPVAAGQQKATEELMQTLHTVQSESLLHELRHIWNETEGKR